MGGQISLRRTSAVSSSGFPVFCLARRGAPKPIGMIIRMLGYRGDEIRADHRRKFLESKWSKRLGRAI